MACWMVVNRRVNLDDGGYHDAGSVFQVAFETATPLEKRAWMCLSLALVLEMPTPGGFLKVVVDRGTPSQSLGVREGPVLATLLLPR